MRAYLLDRLVGFAGGHDATSHDRNDWEGIDRWYVAKVFGGARTDDNGSQSPLIVFDALGTLPADSASTEVRDGVLIETATGVAADQKKFDFEVRRVRRLTFVSTCSFLLAPTKESCCRCCAPPWKA